MSKRYFEFDKEKIFVKRLENTDCKNPPKGKWLRRDKLEDVYHLGPIKAAVKKYAKLDISAENADQFCIEKHKTHQVEGYWYRDYIVKTFTKEGLCLTWLVRFDDY